MGIKKFFWRKSAIIGIVWGIVSLITYFIGGAYSIFRVLPLLLENLLAFPMLLEELIFEYLGLINVNTYSQIIYLIYVLFIILLPLLIGIIICTSIDYIITKIIKRISKER